MFSKYSFVRCDGKSFYKVYESNNRDLPTSISLIGQNASSLPPNFKNLFNYLASQGLYNSNFDIFIHESLIILDFRSCLKKTFSAFKSKECQENE